MYFSVGNIRQMLLNNVQQNIVFFTLDINMPETRREI